MGLGFHRSGEGIWDIDAGWSYGGFDSFRRRLAKEVNIDLDSMEGFGGAVKWETVADDIALLLNHSDCDGVLFPDQCEKIIPRLKDLTKSWEDDDYDKENALQLIDGMQKCVDQETDLIFC